MIGIAEQHWDAQCRASPAFAQHPARWEAWIEKCVAVHDDWERYWHMRDGVVARFGSAQGFAPVRPDTPTPALEHLLANGSPEQRAQAFAALHPPKWQAEASTAAPRDETLDTTAGPEPSSLAEAD